MNSPLIIPEVLTLEEAAGYLRLPKEVIERQATKGQIPARRIEDTWRFLKAAIDDHTAKVTALCNASLDRWSDE